MNLVHTRKERRRQDVNDEIHKKLINTAKRTKKILRTEPKNEI